MSKDEKLLIAGYRHNCNIAKCHFTMPPGIRNHQGSIPCTLLSTLFHFRSNPTEILAHKSPIPEFITIASALSSTTGSMEAMILLVGYGSWMMSKQKHDHHYTTSKLLTMKPLDSKRGRTAFKEKQAAGLHAMGICMTYRMHPFLKVAAAVKPPLASNGITTCFAHPSPGTWQNRVGPKALMLSASDTR